MDKKLDELKGDLDKQPKKSKRETYDEMLELIKEKKVGFVLDMENPIQFLADLHDAGDFYHRNNDFFKYATVKQFLYDFITTFDNIFNNLSKTKDQFNSQ